MTVRKPTQQERPRFLLLMHALRFRCVKLLPSTSSSTSRFLDSAFLLLTASLHSSARTDPLTFSTQVSTSLAREESTFIDPLKPARDSSSILRLLPLLLFPSSPSLRAPPHSHKGPACNLSNVKNGRES